MTVLSTVLVATVLFVVFFFFSSRRRHTRCSRDWSSDVCSSDLGARRRVMRAGRRPVDYPRRRKAKSSRFTVSKSPRRWWIVSKSSSSLIRPILVHEKIAKASHPPQRRARVRGDHASLYELLEQVVFLPWKPEAQSGHDQPTSVDGGLNHQLKEALAGPPLLHSLVLLETRRGDRAQLGHIAVQA